MRGAAGMHSLQAWPWRQPAGRTRRELAMTADDVKQQLQLPDVGQIGVVVEDLDRTIAFYESTFGLGPFDIREVEAPNVWDRGEEKHIKARLGFATMGQIELELIHVLEGDSFHLEFL
ncbi:MAG: hypothetical protein E3J29_03120, partial [Dehalococcoidia bacterium]